MKFSNRTRRRHMKREAEILVLFAVLVLLAVLVSRQRRAARVVPRKRMNPLGSLYIQRASETRYS